MSAGRFRVHPVHLLENSGHVVTPGCCVDPDAAPAWGVYLADAEGREEWEADFGTEREARSYVENREEGGDE